MGKFEFCGCGLPESAAVYIRDGMQAFVDLWGVIEARPAAEHRAAWQAFYAYWPDEGARYFFWYWLDSRRLTEHGGSVPGWLTDEGTDYLAALAEALAESLP